MINFLLILIFMCIPQSIQILRTLRFLFLSDQSQNLVFLVGEINLLFYLIFLYFLLYISYNYLMYC